MKVYTYSQARQQLALVLDQASREGLVQIRRRDGRVFVVKPVYEGKSPLDVAGITTDVTTEEIVQVIREGREREYVTSVRSNKQERRMTSRTTKRGRFKRSPIKK